MKTKLLLIYAGVVTLLVSVSAQAVATNSHSRKGYVRKDSGTYVAPSRATNPNKSKRDNYSHKDNYNPHSGKQGTKK